MGVKREIELNKEIIKFEHKKSKLEKMKMEKFVYFVMTSAIIKFSCFVLCFY